MHNFEAEGDFEGEMQAIAIHAGAVDDGIVSLVRAIQALSEHSLSDLQDLVGPILVMIDDAREEDAPRASAAGLAVAKNPARTGVSATTSLTTISGTMYWRVTWSVRRMTVTNHADKQEE